MEDAPQSGEQPRGAWRQVSYGTPDSQADEGDVADGRPVGLEDAAGENGARGTRPPASRSHGDGREEDGDGRRAARRRNPLALIPPHKVSRLATELYTVSYLILFALLGTLARLGLQALTVYPGAPVVFGVLWANAAGSFVLGFFGEDRMLFRDLCSPPASEAATQEDKESGAAGAANQFPDVAAAKRAHNAAKKTTPLYIGIATGFCGSFTSFSSFMRDAFLALSNRLPTPGDAAGAATAPRNGGYSFMALLAVVLLTLAASMAALKAGGHLAVALEPHTPQLSPAFIRKVLDRLAVPLGVGCWLGAVLLAVFPPAGHEDWRGRAVFALVFAPLGCLARFYASVWLNGRVAGFPLGTFAVNVGGTALLGMAWDLQHVPLGGRVGCQVLQGVMDGFCGCVTTVSTLVSELASLRRGHAYGYCVTTVGVALAFLVVVMGSLQWTRGFARPEC